MDRCRRIGVWAYRRTQNVEIDEVGTPFRRRPSSRTEQADLRHSALQLVVDFQEDRQAAVYACLKENKPIAVK